jgi:hypothetical protein
VRVESDWERLCAPDGALMHDLQIEDAFIFCGVEAEDFAGQPQRLIWDVLIFDEIISRIAVPDPSTGSMAANLFLLAVFLTTFKAGKLH